jgi:hypothetical protein
MQEVVPKKLDLRWKLADGRATTVHCVSYSRAKTKAKLVVFDKPTILLDWADEHGVTEAFGGGFFLRDKDKVLGEAWLAGSELPAERFPAPWDQARSAISIYEDRLTIAPRMAVPRIPAADLLQAGPLLVRNGVSALEAGQDAEGFSATAFQHDEDLTAKRFPRAAIGYNADTIWTVTADGRSPCDTGLFLEELADIFIFLGAETALNLDGGRSASHISGGDLINHPRSDYEESAFGYPIRNAILFS